tara:strand:- start:25485 stop:26081 length:597 start_codon:yes stop_codon:yes gene_type:complete
MDFTDNQTLTESLRIGDEKAYMHLLNKFHRQLHAYALTLTHDPAMAQDIVQNVFLKTWKSRKKLNPEFSIRNFLYKSVYNEFINTYQRNKAMMLLHQKYVESTHEIVENTDDGAIAKMITIINTEIQKLPPKCQKVFILSKKEGLTNNEISEHLDISVKAVEAQITKAFGILKKKLGRKYETILVLIFGNNSKKRQFQ